MLGIQKTADASWAVPERGGEVLGRRFADGVQRYLRDGHATKIKFPPHGALVILGRLDES